jgi:two-component system, OmpR family, alkaline phosphatase synthesis response regulator PhoP
VRDIVVIDNDALICELVTDAVGRSGAAVQWATKGRSGRKLLTAKHFDLAIIDVVLPDASGLALAEIAANENTPVLLITGHPNGTVRLGQHGLLDLPCLLKPFDLVQLRTEMEQVVGESRRNIQRIKDGMAQWRASLAGLEDALANSRRLIDAIRRQGALEPNED